MSLGVVIGRVIMICISLIRVSKVAAVIDCNLRCSRYCC